MIEVHVEGIAHGDAYAGQNILKGKWCEIRESATDPTGTFRVLCLPVAASSPVLGHIWPVNKLVYDTDVEDTTGLGTEAAPAPVDPTGQYSYRWDQNVIASGARIMYYESGEYLTDQFYTTEITSSTAAGTALYVRTTAGTTLGQLQTSSNGATVGLFVRFITAGTNYQGWSPTPANQIHFRMV